MIIALSIQTTLIIFILLYLYTIKTTMIFYEKLFELLLEENPKTKETLEKVISKCNKEEN
jgi:hypothetical protein